MSEAEAIAAVDEPVTATGIAEALHALGLSSGDTVIVHSSMNSLGWVCGDAPAVVDGLMEVIGMEGTLVMPTFTTQYSDPADWENPPVPKDWIETIRKMRPPFRPRITPSRGMGTIPECFRCYPQTTRSRHPLYSLTAWGAEAEALVADHRYDHGLGDGTPLARLYDVDGLVLQLGTGYETNSSLHLAEYRSDTWEQTVEHSVPVITNGQRDHVTFEEVDWSTDGFPALGEAFERNSEFQCGKVGAAEARLLSQRSLVDFGVEWLNDNRQSL